MTPSQVAILSEFRSTLGDLPARDALLRSVEEDLADPEGIPLEDVEGWWREAVRAYVADPRPAVAERILAGELPAAPCENRVVKLKE